MRVKWSHSKATDMTIWTVMSRAILGIMIVRSRAPSSITLREVHAFSGEAFIITHKVSEMPSRPIPLTHLPILL